MPDLAATTKIRLSHHQRASLAVVGVLLLASVCALLFGPARGAREDIAQVRQDLASTEDGIYKTLDTNRRMLDKLVRQLRTARDSLQIQKQGLLIARDVQGMTKTGVDATLDIRRDTNSALATLREVITALGPLRQLRGDIRTLVENTDAGVALARSTLLVARETLTTGRDALSVARDTLSTLRRSEEVQRDLLSVARQTLDQVIRINKKIPTAPIFPTGAPDPQ